MDIGKRIKELRELNNYRSGDFADHIGVSQVFLSYMEAGTKKPSYDTLEKICAALNITLSQFFSEGEDPISLTPELRELLGTARQLPPDKINLLNAFIQSFATGKKPVYVKRENDEYIYDANVKPEGPSEEELKQFDELATRLRARAKESPKDREEIIKAGYGYLLDEEQ